MSCSNILVFHSTQSKINDIQSVLAENGHEDVLFVSDKYRVIDMLAENNVQAVLMDVEVDIQQDCLCIVEEIFLRFDLPVLFLINREDIYFLKMLLAVDNYPYLLKPVDGFALHAMLEMTLYRHAINSGYREQEHCFSAILGSIGDAVIATNNRGLITFLNPEAEVLTGWERGDAIGKELNVVYQTEENVGMLSHNNGVILLTKEGRRIPIEQHISLIQPEQGGTRGFVVNFRDVTETKKVQDRLSLQNAAMEAAANIIVITDVEGNITWVNPAFTQVSGYKKEEVIGKKPRIFKSGEHEDALYEDLWNSLLSGKVWRHELVNKRKDGSKYTVSATITPVENEDGEIFSFISIEEDISELKKNEEFFRTLIEDGRDVISMLNEDGVVEYVSPSVSKVFGYLPNDMINKSIFNFIHPYNLGRVRQFFQDSYDNEEEIGLDEMRVHHYDGSWRFVEGHVKPVLDLAGQKKILINVRDITERKKNVREIITLARISAENPDPVMRISSEGDILYGNKATIKLFDSMGVELGRKVPSVMLNMVRRVLSFDENFETVYNAGPRVYSLLFVPVKSESYVNLYGRDITAQTKANKSMQESERRYRAIVEDQTEMICRYMPDMTISFVNDAFVRLVEKEYGSIVGENFLFFLPEEEKLNMQKAVSALNRENQFAVTEYRQKMADGSQRWVEWTNRALFDDEGMLVEYQSVGREVTGKKRIEALKKEKEAAEAASRAKSEFLSNMSHEIRTPLNGIVGVAELMMETDLNPEQSEYATTMQYSANSLLGIINDILDFAKIEEGRLELTPSAFDLCVAIEEVAGLLAPKAGKKGLDMIVRYPVREKHFFIGDQGRIRQILLNLVNNAIKFTAAGFVMIYVESIRRDENHSVISFAVEDTGVGIEDEKLDKIFERFVQADSSTTRFYGGTGLGLAISKQLAQLMGGDIMVSSNLGMGSTFWFTVELPLADNVDEIFPGASSLTDFEVCIIDPNVVFCKITKELFEGLGLQCRFYTNCAAVREDFSSGEIDPTPERMFFLSESMQDSSCHTLAKEIAEGEYGSKSCFVLVKDPGVKPTIASDENGYFSGVISKPIRPSGICYTINQFYKFWTKEDKDLLKCHGGVIEALAAKRKTKSVIQKVISADVLLVEDNIVNQTVASRMLEKLGCHVVIACNGKEALEQIEKNRFDVIFMDCQMPVMDGYETTEKIRDAESEWYNPDIPIIALTAHVGEEERAHTKRSGMNDYLSKPVQVKNLRDLLEKWTDVQKQHAPEDEEAPQESELAGEELFAYSTAMERMDGDRKLLQEILHIYMEDFPLQIDSLKEAIKVEDYEEAERFSHSLKGGSANVGAEQLRAIFYSMELAAKEKRLAFVAEQLPIVAEAFDNFQKVIKKHGL